VSNPTPLQVRSAFEAGPAPSRFFFRLSALGSAGARRSALWSVRESNPLRRAFQTPALPMELTDRKSSRRAKSTNDWPSLFLTNDVPSRLQRKAEDSNPTRTPAARIAFQTISAPGGFAFRKAQLGSSRDALEPPSVRTAGFEPAVSSPPDWRFRRAKLRPEFAGSPGAACRDRGRGQMRVRLLRLRNRVVQFHVLDQDAGALSCSCRTTHRW
jgi:hypothetical protein